MKFEVRKADGNYGVDRVVALPSDAGGSFLVEHGEEEHRLRQVYEEIELAHLSEGDEAQAFGGDFSSVQGKIVHDERRPGWFRFIGGVVGMVDYPVPYSRNSVRMEMEEAQEVTPFVPTPVPISQPTV